MIVRSYSGRTVNEALDKVRADLGSDALIIESRPIRDPGLWGKRTGYEVVAAADPGRRSSYQGPATAPEDPRDWRRDLLGELRTLQRPTPRAATPAQDQARELRLSPRCEDESGQLGSELGAIRRQLARLASGQGVPTTHLGDELAMRLEEAEMPAETIAELDEALARAGNRLRPERREEFLIRYLGRNLSCHAGIDWSRHRNLVVVGPTGVGKTTTIAKLAGDLVLRQGRRVALATIDTYRVGATDQLQAYADLLGVPFEVAGTPARLGEVVARYRDYDNVLIDTAGRSPRDSARLHELRGFCHAVAGLTVMLALPATCGRAEFAGIVERFSILPVETGVVTKLDEVSAGGRLYGCLQRHRLPIDYLTDGQEVPDDIHPADPLTLARLALRAPAGCGA